MGGEGEHVISTQRHGDFYPFASLFRCYAELTLGGGFEPGGMAPSERSQRLDVQVDWPGQL